MCRAPGAPARARGSRDASQRSSPSPVWRWLSVRSNTVADGMATIVGRHDELVISRQTHLLREGGAFYDADEHWLTATTDPQLRQAVRIAVASPAPTSSR